jgi:holliday junction DNA helicase RuvA
MIAYLAGKVVTVRLNYVILDVDGVGYKVFYTFKKMPESGSEIEVFVHNHIREDASDLYGFDTIDELELFEKLISVNGVGPKAGMAIMACSSSERVIEAITKSDANFFKMVPGIGNKVAAKIILELKSKVTNTKDEDILGSMKWDNEVYDALTALGYKKEEIAKFISNVPAELKNEEKVRWCLRNMNK